MQIFEIRFGSIQINMALKPTRELAGIATRFGSIQINMALKHTI